MGRRRWGPESCLAVIVIAVAVHAVTVAAVVVVMAVAVLSSPSVFVSLKKKRKKKGNLFLLGEWENVKRKLGKGRKRGVVWCSWRMEPNTSFTFRGSSKCTDGNEKLKRG